MNKTHRAIKSQYGWPNMKQKAEDYVKRCQSCQINNVLSPKVKVPMEITTTASKPFEISSLDIVGVRVCKPNPSAALKEIAHHISDCGVSVRNAALDCLARIHVQQQVDVYKMIGKVIYIFTLDNNCFFHQHIFLLQYYFLWLVVTY
ncbi:Cytoskeleton-associated protein 5 [Zootermopsis nevadensis]|uniref:Cytoskeleton-associated protein 5 n=1 Tax=Zootermopsis nevadensis TaxID=136037 RepID=A0A067QQ75_ZOONE|nr:Cytoskeleton-associated protein 5 [Zootermopsis nevadensis]